MSVKNGVYKVVKGDLEFTEKIENDRTSDGWYASELVGMGYKLVFLRDCEKVVVSDADGEDGTL